LRGREKRTRGARVNADGARFAAFFYPALTVTEDDIVTGVGGLERALRAALADA
jgi:hypothetical protein